MCASVLLLAGLVPASAQTTGLIGGGLTALPVPAFGPDLLKNGGFEGLTGGMPTSWSKQRGWVVDQQVKHSGSHSFRATGAFESATQNVALKKGLYKLSGWIRTQGITGGSGRGVRLQFDRRPTQGEWQQTDLITGTRDWTYFEVPNLVVTADAVVTIRLENFNVTAGTVWFDDVKLEETKGPNVEIFMLYPNFRGMLFDDQSQTMKFDVTVTAPGGDSAGHTVRGVLEDEASGQALLSRDYEAAANFVADLEGGSMQPGRAYLVTFSLVNRATGAVVSAYPAYRVSRVPGSVRTSMNVSFDAKNRVLLHGVPRFVLGVYDSGLDYNVTDAFWENLLWSPTGERRLSGMKINFYLNYWYGAASATAMKAMMSNLAKHGVMYLQTGNCFEKLAAGQEFMINSSDAYVRDIGAHPASAGYYTVDECDSTMIPGVFTQYDRLRRLDPDSMTFMTNYGRLDLSLWRDSADILSTDPYPLYHIEPSGGYDHGRVGDWTARTRDAVKDARPIMTVLQFLRTPQGRFPTLQEMRNHAWMAIVEGARGLFWWSLGDNALRDVCSGWCAEKTGYMNNLRTVVNEVAGLEPILLADDAPGALIGNSNAGVIRTKVKIVNGRGYVFAYNTRNAPASATFNWNTAPGSVTVNAENRTLAASGTSFTDSFGPFQAHVYVLDNGGTSAAGGSGPGTNAGPGAPTVRFINPSEGATVNDTATVTLAAAGGSGSGYTYVLAVNSTGVYTGTNPTFSWNTKNFANGEHTMMATVIDGARRQGRAIQTVTVSNTSGGLTVSLTQPTNGTTVSGTSHAIVWVSGAGSGAKTYTLTADGETVGTMQTWDTSSVTIPWNTRSVADGSRVLAVSVRDAAGKTGSKSATVTVANDGVSPPPNSPPPTSPPPTSAGLAVSVTQPVNGGTVSGTHHAIVWVDGAAGGSKTYTLSVAGQTVATMQTASTTAVTIPWNTRSVADGSRALTATVRDAAGRTASKTVTVNVRNGAAAPASPTGNLSVSVTEPTGGETVRGTHWAVVWVNGGAGGSKTFTLTMGSQTVGTFRTASSGPVTIPWNTRSVADGSRALTVTVRDAAGKTGTKSVTVNVRNGSAATPVTAAPTGSLAVSVTEPTGGEAVRGTHSAVVWVNGAAGGAKAFTLSVGSQTVATFTTPSSGPVMIPWDTRSIADGSRALTATVRDGAGKTGSRSVPVTVRNGTTTAPSPGTLDVSMTQPTSGGLVSGTTGIILWVEGSTGTSNTFTLTADGATVGVQTVTRRGPVTIPWDTRSKANGNHTLTATVRDARGRTGSVSVRVVVRN